MMMGQNASFPGPTNGAFSRYSVHLATFLLLALLCAGVLGAAQVARHYQNTKSVDGQTNAGAFSATSTCSSITYQKQEACTDRANLFFKEFSEEFISPKNSIYLSKIHLDSAEARCLLYFISERYLPIDQTIQRTHRVVDVLSSQFVLLSNYYVSCSNGVCENELIRSAGTDIDPLFPVNLPLDQFLVQMLTLMTR